jgi:hypothetical protein
MFNCVSESNTLYDKISKMQIKKQIKPNDLIQIKDPDGYPVLIGKGTANTITQLLLSVDSVRRSDRFGGQEERLFG